MLHDRSVPTHVIVTTTGYINATTPSFMYCSDNHSVVQPAVSDASLVLMDVSEIFGTRVTSKPIGSVLLPGLS